jgi:uncharacterized membrane protein
MWLVLQCLVMAIKILPKHQWTLQAILPWLLLIAGALAMFASFALSAEKMDLLKNSSYHPVCSLNPIINCTSTANSTQGSVFGIPNPLLGIAGYAIVMTIGFVLLIEAQLKRWFWRVFAAGLLFAVVFVHWFIFEALYRIGSLCLFCMVVWAVTIPAFWYTTLYIFQEGHLRVPKRFENILAFARKHHGDILLIWFLIIIALILKRFWYYWSSLI